MAAEITPTERALIDQAIAAGRVTRIPRGYSSSPNAVWDGVKLVYDEPTGISARRNRAARERFKAEQMETLALAAQGLTNTQIAARLQICTTAVSNHKRRRIEA